jgi:hypothetical protein
MITYIDTCYASNSSLISMNVTLSQCAYVCIAGALYSVDMSASTYRYVSLQLQAPAHCVRDDQLLGMLMHMLGEHIMTVFSSI